MRTIVWTAVLTAALLAGAAIGAWQLLVPGPRVATTTEHVSAPIIFRTPGGLIEVAGIKTTELFEKKSMLHVAGVNLGTTVSQIRVPVTYRYQIALGQEWRAYMSGDKFLVIAPAVKASLPVAIDTAVIQMQTKSGWARFNSQANLDALLKEITPELEKKAKSSAYVELQREAARKTITEFVTKWLITQEQWKSVKPAQVRVYFSDEPIERLRSFGPEYAGTM